MCWSVIYNYYSCMVKPLKVQEFSKRRGLRWMTRGNSSSPSSQFCECPSPMAFLPMNLMHSDKALGKIYPWRKVVCLFCFVPWRSNELLRYFRSCSWSLWKTLKERGVHQLSFILVFGLAFRSSWMIFSLNITLNRSWK